MNTISCVLSRDFLFPVVPNSAIFYGDKLCVYLYKTSCQCNHEETSLPFLPLMDCTMVCLVQPFLTYFLWCPNIYPPLVYASCVWLLRRMSSSATEHLYYLFGLSHLKSTLTVTAFICSQ